MIFKIPPKHYKTGENNQTNLGPSFDATLDQVLTQKNTHLGPSFDSTPYIYIHTYTCSCSCVFFPSSEMHHPEEYIVRRVLRWVFWECLVHTCSTTGHTYRTCIQQWIMTSSRAQLLASSGHGVFWTWLYCNGRLLCLGRNYAQQKGCRHSSTMVSKKHPSRDGIFSSRAKENTRNHHITWRLEPSIHSLLASHDVIISSQICSSNLQRVLTLGDGCWLPNWVHAICQDVYAVYKAAFDRKTRREC